MAHPRHPQNGQHALLGPTAILDDGPLLSCLRPRGPGLCSPGGPAVPAGVQQGGAGGAGAQLTIQAEPGSAPGWTSQPLRCWHSYATWGTGSPRAQPLPSVGFVLLLCLLHKSVLSSHHRCLTPGLQDKCTPPASSDASCILQGPVTWELCLTVTPAGSWWPVSLSHRRVVLAWGTCWTKPWHAGGGLGQPAT